MTEQNITMVLSDVDNTLLPHDRHYPSALVQAAARDLRKNGISLHTATSRSHALHHRLVSPLDLQGNLCILDGGATVTHADNGDVVWSKWLSPDTTKQVVGAIGRLCTNIHFNMQSRSSKPIEVLKAMERDPLSVQSAPSVFAIFGIEKGQDILASLAELSGIQHTPIMRYDKSETLQCIQVVAPGVDKHSGVAQMLTHANLLDRRGLAIGDNKNDFALFAAVEQNDGIKVAMGDAPDELKNRADWVAPPAEEDGFVEAMKHYNLI